jgi:hypothetical protein
LLADLIKDCCLNEVEGKVFDIFATKEQAFSVKELARMVFGNALKNKRRKAELELEISDAIESLRGRAVPILKGYRGKYELANDLQSVVNMITEEEKKVEYAQYNLKVQWINYGRQIDSYHKLNKDESK